MPSWFSWPAFIVCAALWLWLACWLTFACWPALVAFVARVFSVFVAVFVSCCWIVSGVYWQFVAALKKQVQLIDAWANNQRCAAVLESTEQGTERGDVVCAHVAPHVLALVTGDGDVEHVPLCDKHEPYALYQRKRFAFVDKDGNVTTLTLA